ncbi:WbqC family protein [Delftia acidovorans]|jgi:hypothetical protein
MKKIAILQSNYIPWKGYFDLINSVDEFVFYDQVQYTKNDWRNRNKIKTPQGLSWLTVPVGIHLDRRICDVTIDDAWQKKHWKTLLSNYRRAKNFDVIAEFLEPLYLDSKYENLSQMNQKFIREICDFIGIDTKLSDSSQYEMVGDRVERLVNICIQASGSEYVSGPSAKSYIDESIFQDHKVDLTWFSYGEYPEYPQLWGDFQHQVSILDLLFNCGKDSAKYIKRPG